MTVAATDPRAERILQRLTRIYGSSVAQATLPRLLDRIRVADGNGQPLWSERDVALITYGDSICRGGEPPLRTLGRFLRERLDDCIEVVHILPFFPYSSDDGFAVVDYRRVNPMLGDWADIESIAGEFDLMVDLVLNHVSSRSMWFTEFLARSGRGANFFIEVDPESDVSEVVRPRVRPLLAGFNTEDGEKFVWATFGEDQIDLNFANPEVLLEMIDIFQEYLRRGARVVRLDAVAFLWKRLGSACIHLDETHEVVKLLRDVAELVAPGTIVLTETNVPHHENISYFGDCDEAHAVYQFALPPLLLHALFTGDATYLSHWARSLEPPPAGCTFINFTASHDGIGMRPAEGLLPGYEIERLIEGMRRVGAYASSRDLGGGRKAVYEINTTYFDACRLSEGGEDGYQLERFLCSQLLMLSLQGIPAIYIHSLTATPNDHLSVDQTGHLRSVNRHRWQIETLDRLIDTQGTVQQAVYAALTDAIRLRRTVKAFHPDTGQRVLTTQRGLFAFVRTPQSGPAVTVIANVGSRRVDTDVDPAETAAEMFCDLLTGRVYEAGSRIELMPYQAAWLSSLGPE